MGGRRRHVDAEDDNKVALFPSVGDGHSATRSRMSCPGQGHARADFFRSSSRPLVSCSEIFLLVNLMITETLLKNILARGHFF